MINYFATAFISSILFSGSGHTNDTAPDSVNIEEFVMHHVKDQIIFPLKIGQFDISITKHVLMIWIAAALLMLILPLILRSKSLVPKGPANFVEWIILFLKDSAIQPYLGEDSYRFAPYLLTAFFFIIFCNLLGLVPMAATATGNISVTAALALLTFFLVQISSIRKNGLTGYIRSFVPSGVPFFVVPIIFVVEILGMITKHFALAIRLFANMVAGHLVIFTVLGLIFMFKNYLIAPVPILTIIFLSLLEILIALIQAYIFTILSAVFIGTALKPHH